MAAKARNLYAGRIDVLSIVLIGVTFVGLWLVWPAPSVARGPRPNLDHTHITFAPVISPGSLLDPYRKPLEGDMLRDAVMTADEPLELVRRRELRMLALHEPTDLDLAKSKEDGASVLSERAEAAMSEFSPRSPEERLVVVGRIDPQIITELSPSLQNVEFTLPPLDALAGTQGPWAVTAFVALDESGAAKEVFIEKASEYEHVNQAVLRTLRRSSSKKLQDRLTGRVTINYVGVPVVSASPAPPVENGKKPE